MNKRIAVVSGGDSGEFGISLQSGEVIAKYLNDKVYDVFPILMKNAEWYFLDDNDNRFEIDKNDFSLEIEGEKILFDGVAIAIHGTPGEDGKLQGYFDMLNIPYTSCDHATSALTFNKYFCKNFVKPLGVATANSVYLTNSHTFDIQEVKKKLTLPIFVKPNNGGSSVGMSKVKRFDELGAAVEKAFREDDEILLEEFIQGREITCGVLKAKEGIEVFPIAEIISKNDFFDFEAKYDPSLAEEIVPAQISKEVENECKKTSTFLYDKLNCKGIVRFDYIFNDSGLYFLEVNTVPGMTEASIIPKMAGAHGMSLQDLFGRMVDEMF
jgi:D-alanine-D-alanine ligase